MSLSKPLPLPVVACREEILTRLEHPQIQCLIIIGETASGKSTQIPQYVLESKVGQIRAKMIGITQPRRIAAISLATRVAEERGEAVGETVGYSVRFDENYSHTSTKLKYMTDGILMREHMRDTSFARYSCVILDEFHERSLNTDVLLSFLKIALAHRNASNRPNNRLKLIIMSATYDYQSIVDYFGADITTAYYVPGRRFNIQTYSIARETDYLTGIMQYILKLHKELPLEDNILAFLPGQEDIEYVVGVLKMSKEKNVQIYPLYSALSHDAQLKAISCPTKGVRRIVISTNIAETSLTIPGITVVLDSGFVKRKVLNSRMECHKLQLERISKAEFYQRSGRAGREKDGVCYRFYTNEEFSLFPKEPEPEIKRSSLSGVLLHFLKHGIDHPTKFRWLDPPAERSLCMAVHDLLEISAIENNSEPLQLTPCGHDLAEYPLEPCRAKILMIAYRDGFVESVAKIFGVLESESIFQKQVNDQVMSARSRFFSPLGDLLTYINILDEFKVCPDKKVFWQTYKLNIRAIRFAQKVKRQLVAFCKKLHECCTPPSKRRDDVEIRDLVVQALPKNIAYLVGDTYIAHRGNNESVEVKIHPSSVLAGKRHRTVHYMEMIQLGENETFICHCTYLDRGSIRPTLNLK